MTHAYDLLAINHKSNGVINFTATVTAAFNIPFGLVPKIFVNSVRQMFKISVFKET